MSQEASQTPVSPTLANTSSASNPPSAAAQAPAPHPPQPPTTTTKRVTQRPVLVVQNHGKVSGAPPRKRSNPGSSRRKSTTSPSPVPAPDAPTAIEGHPELKDSDVMWVAPEPGYGTPRNLNEMGDNGGKIFPRWASWENATNVGFTLFDEGDQKWWADAASVHILSRAEGFKISHSYFSYVVKRENRVFSYGFIAKATAQASALRNLSEFSNEMNSVQSKEVYKSTPSALEEIAASTSLSSSSSSSSHASSSHPAASRIMVIPPPPPPQQHQQRRTREPTPAPSPPQLPPSPRPLQISLKRKENHRPQNGVDDDTVEDEGFLNETAFYDEEEMKMEEEDEEEDN